MIDSNNRLLSTLIIMQLLTLGILVVMLFNPPSQNSAVGHNKSRNNLNHEHTSASPVYGNAVTAELKIALREIIRDELAAPPSSAVAGATGDVISQPDAMLTDSELQEQETAAAVSATVIQQATSAGIWTRADTEALLPHLGRISADQRLALMDQLYSAINRQEMEIRDFPPL